MKDSPADLVSLLTVLSSSDFPGTFERDSAAAQSGMLKNSFLAVRDKAFPIAAALAFAAILAVYSNHFHNAFHFDDVHTITEIHTFTTSTIFPAFSRTHTPSAFFRNMVLIGGSLRLR